MDGIDAVRVGLLAEDRFFRILETAENRPGWLVKVRRANPRLDAAGVDAVCWVARIRDGRKVAVPVQVKSSYLAMEEYFKESLPRWLNRVPVVVVNNNRTDEQVCSQLFTDLIHVRNGNYDYVEFLKYCMFGGTSLYLKRRMAEWEKEREIARLRDETVVVNTKS